MSPATADMAAHAFRAWLWDEEGWTVWNAQWYGGHHVPGYSVLFPPLAGLVGAHAAVAASGAAAAGALAALARLAPPERRALASWLLAVGAVANLVVGRGPFLLGVAFGALALHLALRGRGALAAIASLACVLASPVAGLFLCVIGAGAWASAPRRWVPVAALVAPAVAGGLALGVLFPEGGNERFVASAFWPMLAVTAATAALLPGRLRWVAGAYLLLLVVTFAVDSPVGHNATRLGVLAGPAVLAACGRGPTRALVAVGSALLYLGWLPAVRAIDESRGDPAARAEFHAPLLAFLDRAGSPGDRVEIPLTRNHWEAFHVARRRALARGWERQLDLKINGLFYDGRPLTPGRYEAWLRREGVRWVAVPDAPLDFSAREEARVVAARPSFLRPAMDSGGWRVFEVRGVGAADRILAAGPSELRVRFAQPGRVVLRRRWTRYWRVAHGRARVSRSGEWLAVEAAEAGDVRLIARL